MNSFKRKALTCAVLAGLGGVATTAEAVYRNPDGTGTVLIYPYYTVQTAGGPAGTGNSFNTYISVTNTTSSAKVTKVRFREGRTSAEVLDFNLYLSPNDVWVGAVGPQSTAADAPAILVGRVEKSCTYPEIPVNGEPFKNSAYQAAPESLPGTGLDRTREGYVEIFDMGTLPAGSDIASKITHTAIGVEPPNCSAMRRPLTGTEQLSLLPSTGGLYGEGTIINVVSGASMGYKADALAAYNSATFYADVSTLAPQLGANAAGFSMVLDSNNRMITDTWTAVAQGANGSPALAAGVRAVASVFMHSNVLNDYILETGTKSNTDWVMTFPGKHEFYQGRVTPAAPFTALLGTDGACEAVTFTFFDRDEQSTTPPPGGFSPQSSGTGGPGASTLCWETTVVSIRNGQPHTSAADITTNSPVSGVLGSRNARAVSVLANPPFAAGWIDMAFTGANATTGIASATGSTNWSAAPGFTAGAFLVTAHTYFGLPVTGFMVTARSNQSVACTLPGGTAGSCQGNYMALFDHSYRTRITP